MDIAAQDNQKLLFDRIIQFNAAELQGGNGSGLGLWISKVVIEKHKGSIGVISSGVSGEGSTFFIELPLSASIMRPDAYSKTAQLPASGALFATEDKSLDAVVEFSNDVMSCQSHTVFSTALIVDDSALNRKMLRSMITEHFLDIKEAVDGIDAIEVYKSIMASGSKVSIIFMDDSMPRMSGRDAIFELRRLGYFGIVVAVTGNVLPEDMKALCEAGANYVCEKPVNRQKLMELIRKL
jgi:CheY-like chemotaxis protein